MFLKSLFNSYFSEIGQLRQQKLDLDNLQFNSLYELRLKVPDNWNVNEQLLCSLREYLETGIPESCGRCGTPDATCDCNCMNAANYSAWREDARRFLKSAGNRPALAENASTVHLSANLFIALDYLDHGIPKYGKIGFGHYQSWLDRTNKSIAPEPVVENEQNV